ncbi:DNA-directed RNA polymerase subunit beta [Amnibacterium sp. CER49]|uniref:DNA-directed RNA polymerase subunit beta n=1 Tax=Amnibacterium sp. CER49 TaxID=3039161 RepID=UPI00244A3048|nr:DNA-directed RNA polymerase subunit beta [Amnibacterium sp. CER49]MDH2444112.1 DNA-directed RNA polymerase subunit beta [Amnibacterium sp. CER49]
MADFHRPVRMPAEHFDFVKGGEDPAVLVRTAHETAQALVSRVRADPDPEIVERLVAFAEREGIDAVAELWSRAAPHSLPGALWRLYLLREMTRRDAELVSLAFARGTERLKSIDALVAGAPTPAGPEELLAVADEILRGVFEGDLALALDRAAAFARVTASGCTDLADDADATEPGRAGALTTRAARLARLAEELSASARLWRDGALD